MGQNCNFVNVGKVQHSLYVRAVIRDDWIILSQNLSTENHSQPSKSWKFCFNCNGYLDQSLSPLAIGNGSCGLLPAKHLH